jgi:Protein of unknown function (DUF2867)
MPSKDCAVNAVAVPSESRVAQLYETTNLADAYAVRLPEGAITDPELLARFIFSNQAAWIKPLLRLRDALVADFGIKTSTQLEKAGDKRIAIFKIYETNAHEIILGEDDSHLDFRVSVMHQTHTSTAENTQHVVLSTVVHCHNRFGRIYIALIAPFHRMIVQSLLRKAAHVGWPTAPKPRRI